MKRHGRLRLLIQAASAALLNGYAVGFTKGKIFGGNSKLLCVPVLNCYSCPGAAGSCPIGAMQAIIGSGRFNIPFYVMGFLMLFGIALGRLVCGFICPFGLVQDLLHKIPVKKPKVPAKADRSLRYVKYAVLLVLVILLPLLLTDPAGMASPFFCKLFCPAGTLEAGIPLILANNQLRALTGVLFDWKIIVLIAMIIGSMFISRFFCKYFCPLGAIYSFFNKISLYRMDVDKSRCTGCKSCEKACPMGVDVLKNINSSECIRCGRCKAACADDAINSGFGIYSFIKRDAAKSR